MDFIFDMVHHNPGEQEFGSSFSDSRNLVEYGYNSQVFKHINCVATFDKLRLDLWPAGSKQRTWLDEFTVKRQEEIDAAKAAGLKVYYHIDLFVLPKMLVEKYSAQVCDDNGKISLDKDFTLELHRIMFDEIFARFPDIDGLIVRVGETYLYDTPYHCGNGAVNYDKVAPSDREKQQFVKLIDLLRQEVCVKHSKHIFFRTWDCFSDRFHASLPYYLDITNQIEPHEKLVFSIKHTQLDFWRYVEINPCLGEGKHPQIIEVQCQREYEGKGAYPSYVMDKVINGFPETKHKIGLKDMVDNPLIRGVYGWSRGGGWYGPYITDEFWPQMNAYVISQWFNDTSRGEQSIFEEYCREQLGLDESGAKKFRNVVMLCDNGLLKGRYCKPFDVSKPLDIIPANNWMRDDRLGGINMLEPVFRYLLENNLFEAALKEKSEAVELWKQALSEFEAVNFADECKKEFVKTSIVYGLRLFEFIAKAWEFMANEYAMENGCKSLVDNVTAEQCIELWQEYQKLFCNKYAASLYKGQYWNMPNELLVEGVLDFIKEREIALV